MAPKSNPRVTRHITFTASENACLCRRAEEVGMKVSPYIKQAALHGVVKGFPLDALTQHEKDIGEIVHAVKATADRPHPDRWLYEADLEMIDDKLDELTAIERDILARLRRRLA